MLNADETKHVVMFSGGIGSWAAAKRVAKWYGTNRLVLLFADTLIEDEDLYRFIKEAAANVGGEFVRVADGRTPWQVFNDVGFMGNSRVDPCSKLLKRDLLDRWVELNCDPLRTVCYVGVDWTEEHRIKRLAARKAEKGWTYTAPMCEAPYRSKQFMLGQLKKEGIKPPRLYEMGFAHNNCGGFCVKSGQAAFANLLAHFPERYLEHEQQEELFRAKRGDYSIMKDRRNKTTNPLPMKVFRERIQGGSGFDKFDVGGCGCAIDDGEEEEL